MVKTYKEFYKKKLGENIELSDYIKNGDAVDEALAQFIVNKGGSYFGVADPADTEEMIIQSQTAKNYLGDMPTFLTIARGNVYLPWIFKGSCAKGHIRNLNPEFSKRVYICSPYRANTPTEKAANIQNAIDAAKEILKQGDIPVVPHLYFPNFMNDDDKVERAWAIQTGKLFIDTCDEIWVFSDHLSEGMKEELEYAARRGMRAIM